MMTKYEKITVTLSFFTLVGIIFIGYFQVSVNSDQAKLLDRQVKLQDYVAIVAIPGKNTIDLVNAGKINLYLHKFEVLGNVQDFSKKPRMIAAGTGAVATYWIPFPLCVTSSGQDFEGKLYLQDEYGVKYISEFGGNARDSNIWSYKTYKNDWNL